MRLTSVLLLTALICSAAKKTPTFQTSDRCIACHNELTTPSGQDVSIGFEWRASLMANSSRDPYWQASARRETMDHPQVTAQIEDECSVCHMPVTRYEAKLKGEQGAIFTHLPFEPDKKEGKEAADGVDCSVCHQIGSANLGKRESFNGGFTIDKPDSPNVRPEYGPFELEQGQQRIMRTSTGGFQPQQNTGHIQKSELCATCHTLYTTARGPDGKAVGELPEQMPYKEWLNSDFRTKKTCQDCHMTAATEPVAITRVFGVPRENMKRHVFVASNFFMERMLNRYRDDLDVGALPQELTRAADNTVAYLQSQAAEIAIRNVQVSGVHITADVEVRNLGGHKLPTAFPSRRAWLHLVVRDSDNKVVFESGALHPDGSIEGNDNDADPARYEPHYAEITRADQVQIYEDIMGDPAGHVTTGILTGVRFLKDNRLLPQGFDKAGADPDIRVQGEAASDTRFVGGSHTVRYSVDAGSGSGPFRIEAELLYQPIGYRWANNLKAYVSAEEPRRFTGYYDSMSGNSAEVLARAYSVK